MPPDAFKASPATPFDFLRLDFTHRSSPEELPEQMDQPGTYRQLRACLRDLARVNRTTLGYRPTLRFLRHALAGRGSRVHEEPWRIVDAGCGGGDTLRSIERWARRRHVPVKLTGVDLNPHAIRAAREFSPAQSAIRWVVSDALAFTQPGGIDFVISALFLHHLEEPDIVQFLSWMERVARRGWFINDLRRNRASFVLFRALAHLARWHPFVRHDGPVSIRRSFREDDWKRMLKAAGIPLEQCRIERRFPGRLCVSRYR